VQGQLVAEVTALSDLDRVDLADQVGDRSVGRRQLLAKALVAVHPCDRCRITQLVEQVTRVFANRSERIVVDLAAGNDRHPFIEQTGEATNHARLGLAALAEEDHIVPGEECVLELGHDGVLVTQHTFEERLA